MLCRSSASSTAHRRGNQPLTRMAPGGQFNKDYFYNVLCRAVPSEGHLGHLPQAQQLGGAKFGKIGDFDMGKIHKMKKR